MNLLEKSKRINQLLQRSGSDLVDFSEMAEVLNKALKCNVYIIYKSGKVLGHGLVQEFGFEIIEDNVLGKETFPEEFNQVLLNKTATTTSLENKEDHLFFDNGSCLYNEKSYILTPVYGGGERLATLFLIRYDKDFFNEEDLFLAEYAAAVIGMEIISSEQMKKEKEIREKTATQIAVNSLSFTEQVAIQRVFQQLENNEGLLITSKIADEAGFSRSIIVNALRKLECAGVLKSRSLGMKGTHVKILNNYLIPAVEKVS